MNNDKLSRICRQATSLIEGVSDYIAQQSKQFSAAAIEVKSLNSLVSYVDQEAERMLVNGLKKICPRADFLTEEKTVAQNKLSEMYWIIDPLDGTTNFMHRIPFYAISVALMYRDEIVLGIVYSCTNKECFYAWQGGGAYMNGKPIRVSGTTTMAQSLIATGFPYYDFTHQKLYIQILQRLMRSTRGIRRLGAASLDLAYVACSRFDAFYEWSLHPWDVAAGILLVREAGGDVYPITGAANPLWDGQLLAINPSIFPEWSSLIEQIVPSG